MLRERAPAILAPDHDERWAGDGRQAADQVRTVEERPDLPLMLLRRGAHHHAFSGAKKRLILHPVLMDHRRQPAVGERSHAFGEGEIDQHLPLRLLAFPPGVDARCR